MEVQNQVGRSLRANLARLRDVLDSVASQGTTSLGHTRPSGAQLLWHGYTQLAAMTFAFELRDEYG